MRTLDDLTVARVDQSGPSDDEEFTYVDIGSVDNLSKKIVGPKRVAVSAAPSRAKQTLRAGDVIVSMTRPSLNAVALVPPELDGAVGSSGFHVLRAQTEVLPEWLYFGVQTRRFIDAMSDVVQGALYPAVRPRDIRAFPLPVPSVSAQRNIVDDIETQFSRLDQAIAGLQRIKVNLARHRASMLRHAIEGRLVEPSVPWTTLPLSEVAEVQLGQQRAPVHAEAAVQLPYVRAANITWSGLDITDVKTMGFPNPARYQLADGDILLSEASGSAKEVGKPALWRNEIPGACYQKTLIRVRSDRSRLLPEFAYYFFLHTCLSGQFARLAPGVGILHLTAERMLSWPTVVPPLADQQPVCYSAVVKADFKKYQQMFGATMDIAEFHDLFVRRSEGAKLKVPKAVEAAFDLPQTEDERAIKALIDHFNTQQATAFEQEMFKQRKRLADAERALQTKASSKFQGSTTSVRIGLHSYSVGPAKLREPA